MKRHSWRFLRSSLVLFLCVLLIPGITVLAPSDAQAFGSLAENGTAQFMGIGINPTRILHVSGSGAGSVPLFQRGSDSAGFIIERTSTNRWVLGVNESPTLGTGFVLSTIPTGTTSVPRLLVTQDGYVGIGTTTPAYKLHVDGTVGASYSVIAPAFYDWSGSNCFLDPWGNAQGISMVVMDRVGIGTISPWHGAELHVYNDNTTNGHYAIYGETTSGNTAGVGAVNLGARTAGFLGGQALSVPAGAYGGYYNVDGSVRNWGAIGGSASAGYFYGNVIVDSGRVGIGTGASPNSPLQVAGAVATAFKSITLNSTTENYTLTAADSVIAVTSEGSPRTVYLPDAGTCAGRQYTIKSMTAIDVIVDGGEDTIDGGDTVSLGESWRYVTVVSDGSNWLIVGNGP